MPARRFTRAGLVVAPIAIALGCTLFAPSDDDLVGDGGAGGGGNTDASSGGKGGATGGAGGTSASGGGTTGGGAGSAGTGGIPSGGTSGAAGAGGGGAGGSAGSGGSAGAPAIPTNGLVLWLDATTGVIAPGGPVTGWADLSPAKNDATQPANGARPTVVSDSGKQGVSFDGSDDYLALPAGFSDFSQGLTAFAVVRIASAGPCRPIFQFCNGPEIDDISLQSESDGTMHYEVLFDEIVSSSSQVTPNTLQLMSAWHFPPANASIYVNGQPAGSGTMALPVVAQRVKNYVGIGEYGGCGSFQGVMFELLIYARSLSNPEQATVQGYLKNKWSCCT